MCQTSVNLTPCCIGHISSRSGTNVPRFNIYRSIISLSEITHQMWHDYPFSQRNKPSKIAVEVKVGGNGEEGLDKILKG